MIPEKMIHSKGNILVVDDTPANLQLLAEMLSQQAYKVRIIPDGSLVLQSVLAHPPDLILLDILMPEHEINNPISFISSNIAYRVA